MFKCLHPRTNSTQLQSRICCKSGHFHNIIYPFPVTAHKASLKDIFSIAQWSKHVHLSYSHENVYFYIIFTASQSCLITCWITWSNHMINSYFSPNNIEMALGQLDDWIPSAELPNHWLFRLTSVCKASTSNC